MSIYLPREQDLNETVGGESSSNVANDYKDTTFGLNFPPE
jgi:hypothetical protein